MAQAGAAQMSRHAARHPLVGYLYADGRAICVDCDVYPPNTRDIRKGDPEVSKICSLCGTPLAEVTPLGE